MKIQITESDIKSMVFEGVKKIFEAIRHGTASGSGVWEPQDVFIDSGLDNNEIDAMIRRYPQIEWNGYNITAKISSTEYSGEDGPGNVSSYDGEKNFGGQYDKAMADIANVGSPVLRQKLSQSLKDFCESLETEDFEENSPYDMLQEGREYDTWLGHSDIPGSDGRFFNVEFYLGPDGQIGYRVKGDSNQKLTEPYEVKPGSWLDNDIRAYMESHMDEIRTNLFI